MSNKKTIAFFSGYYLPFLGGIERYTDKLTEELVRLGHKVVIVTTKHESDLPDREEVGGRIIYRLPSKKLFQQRYPILDINETYRQLMREIEQEGIETVICNTRFHLTTLAGLRFAKRHRLPSLVIDHGSSHFTVNNRFLDFFGAIYEHVLTSYVKHLNKNFYAVSKRSGDWLKHFGITSKGVIYNSVPASLADEFKGASFVQKKPEDLFVTYAGRIIKEKGVALLLGAFQSANFSDNIQLQIAGDGPELATLKAQYQSEQIHFLGKLDFTQTMSLMAQSDIFVYPSMYPEGLPTSILEAGLLKNAIIATDRGGTVEVINNDNLGIIIEENEASLGAALQELTSDENKRQEMQLAIQRRITEQFTWTQTAKHLEHILNKMTNSSK